MASRRYLQRFDQSAFIRTVIRLLRIFFPLIAVWNSSSVLSLYVNYANYYSIYFVYEDSTIVRFVDAFWFWSVLCSALSELQIGPVGLGTRPQTWTQIYFTGLVYSPAEVTYHEYLLFACLLYFQANLSLHNLNTLAPLCLDSVV